MTGRAGFLGSRIVQRLQREGCRQVLVPRGAEYDVRDLSGIRSVLKGARPDIIIHSARNVDGIGAKVMTVAKRIIILLLMLAIALTAPKILGSLLVNVGAVACTREVVSMKFDIASLFVNSPPVPDSNPCLSSLRFFQQAAAWDSHNAQAQGWLGMASLLQKKYVDAYDHLLSGLGMVPNNSVVEFRIGVALYKLGRTEDAIDKWRGLQAEGFLMGAGVAAREHGEFAQAEQYHRLVMIIAPDLVEAHLELADDLFAWGKYDEALVEYRLGFAKPIKPSSVNLGEAAYHQAGFHYLLEAWQNLALPKSELVLVGHPVGQESLTVLERYDPELFRWIREVDDIHLMYASADVFVFPSLVEGFGMVTLEAMASGVPVIVTENANAVVRDGLDGYVIPIRDVNALQDRIRRLHDDASLRESMGEAARKRAEEFTWQRYHTGLVEILDRVLGNQQGDAHRRVACQRV